MFFCGDRGRFRGTEEKRRRFISLRDVAVVAPNLHRRYSGVTSTIAALLPVQARSLSIASAGFGLPPGLPVVRLTDLLIHGWTRPKGRAYRIWHARRNDEMIVGILLVYLLRQPWRLVFTSAAQRRHTRFTRFLLRRMDALIATSSAAASYLERPSRVIHHGVDTGRFSPAPDRAGEWESAGLPGRFGIGTFGRVRKQKGTDLFIGAMIELLPRYPEWTAVITGLCAPEDSVFVEGLKRRISEAGLLKRILVLGVRPPAEMPLWFRRVTVYVAPMRWEGFGLTPLEAMASGAAVVATRTGAAPLLVDDGVTGSLIEPDSLDALVRALEPLMADPARAVEMGRAGRTRAVDLHDIVAESAAIREVYEKLWEA
ncbi:MAG: glycosyltransferase family 4 protein [Nitrospirae bacterium]|nr:glycosyltransferase family 4 protein [Nitrospirota bacterium]